MESGGRKLNKTLWIQIPCFNEEENLPKVLIDLPKQIEGFSAVKILVILDGCTDRTLEVAKEFNVEHFIIFPSNRGLSAAFQAGIQYCIQNGADIIVNTDADNQYPSTAIVELIQPIQSGSADVVIGDRAPANLSEFRLAKRILQYLGSKLTSKLCGVKINDATSGFRAYTIEAAEAIQVTNPFTYTLETLIQLAFLKFKIEHIYVQKNPSTRESRLFKSIWQYVRKNGFVLLRSYIQFAPLTFFGFISFLFALLALGCYIPTLVDFFGPNQGGHLQSLLIGTLLTIASIQTFTLALLADATKSLRISIERRMSRFI